MRGRMLHRDDEGLLHHAHATDRRSIVDVDDGDVVLEPSVPGEVLLGTPIDAPARDGRFTGWDGDRFVSPCETDLGATDESATPGEFARQHGANAWTVAVARPARDGNRGLPTWDPSSASGLPRPTGRETRLYVLMWIVTVLTVVAQLVGLYVFGLGTDMCRAFGNEECVADHRKTLVRFEMGIGVGILTAFMLCWARWRIRRRRRSTPGHTPWT